MAKDKPEPVVKAELDVDDFIYRQFNKNQYARWVLMHFRLPAALKLDFEPFMREHRLFCTFEGKRHRVTGASRFGDVYLTTDYTIDAGYEARVAVSQCSDWGSVP